MSPDSKKEDKVAWTPASRNKGNMIYFTETYTLPSTGTGYSSEIDFIRLGIYGGLRYVRFAFNASTVSGANLDIALYGAYDSGGTKIKLLESLVPDITATGEVATSTAIDMSAYPMPFYYAGWEVDADESANTMDVTLTAAAAAPAMGI